MFQNEYYQANVCPDLISFPSPCELIDTLKVRSINFFMSSGTVLIDFHPDERLFCYYYYYIAQTNPLHT